MYAFNLAAIFYPGHPYIESTTVLSDTDIAPVQTTITKNCFLAHHSYTSRHLSLAIIIIIYMFLTMCIHKQWTLYETPGYMYITLNRPSSCTLSVVVLPEEAGPPSEWAGPGDTSSSSLAGLLWSSSRGKLND